MTVQSSVRGYTARDVSSLLGFSVRQIRSFTSDGLFESVEENDGLLSFEDVVVLRAAKGLVDESVSPRRVRSILRKLRAQLPKDKPLSAVRLSVEGGEIVVHDGPRSWEPASGQVVFDFDAPAMEGGGLTEAVEITPAGPSAQEWYENACDLEDHAPQEAHKAYLEALAQDPQHVGSHLNLGRLLHQSKDLKNAEQHYRSALDTQPDDPTAAYNLGVVLEDLGLESEAIKAYEQAIECDPGCRDAHHNAARLYEERGDKASALRLLKDLRALGQ